VGTSFSQLMRAGCRMPGGRQLFLFFRGLDARFDVIE
jgi:hypothetical protein